MHRIVFRLIPSSVVVVRTTALCFLLRDWNASPRNRLLQKYVFEYTFLRECEASQYKVGNWKQIPVFSIASPQTLNTRRTTQFFPFLQAYFIMAESVTPTKAGRASPNTSQVPSTQDTVPEEFLRFYKKPLRVEVDVTTLEIDKYKKYGQIRMYRQKRVGEVKRSLMANPLEEPVTVTVWQSRGT